MKPYRWKSKFFLITNFNNHRTCRLTICKPRHLIYNNNDNDDSNDNNNNIVK